MENSEASSLKMYKSKKRRLNAATNNKDKIKETTTTQEEEKTQLVAFQRTPIKTETRPSCQKKKNIKRLLLELNNEDNLEMLQIDPLEEEKKLFKQRVASFLNQMHLIQGNRHFIPWKGSVVDSVVGAFLSQNTADHSSSSAFISLAAKYRNPKELPGYCEKIDWVKRRRSTLRRVNKKNQNKIDWDKLRRLYSGSRPRVKDYDTMDSLNWESVRVAHTEEVSNAIMERGMHEKLAERIQNFLQRLVKDHEHIDLEWLRDVPPHDVKEFLMSIEGLGVKTVDCIQLLALGQLAFPVDTNVSRIVVRLGWVPLLTPLGKSVQLHLLKKYPPKTIQKYLWPRLSTLDIKTLYELHYHMITFGKVFCTKKSPNCNACPMRAECKHFASEQASTRLALPSSKGKGKNVASSSVENFEMGDIEDFFYKDPNQIPLCKFNVGEFTENLQNYPDENIMFPFEGDTSKALVALTSQMPEMKFLSRLRTKHQVFEIPDDHPLLVELDKREPDDVCPYLLAVWILEEFVNESVQPREFEEGPSCSNLLEENPATVLGTFLIPCRTAMKGRFPLNGTYFQVNEVFADDESSKVPIKVHWEMISGLQRRSLYCAASTTTILKGLKAKDIQQCFWRGFMCFRGFNRRTRRPTPLPRRFRHQATKKEKRRSNCLRSPTPGDLKAFKLCLLEYQLAPYSADEINSSSSSSRQQITR